MKNFIVLTSILVCIIAVGVLAAQQPARTAAGVPPPWAFGFDSPPPAAAAAPAAPAPGGAGGGARGAGGGGGAAAPPPDTTMHKLAGSTASFTAAQVRNAYGPADWFPGDHPAMPDIVSKGKQEQQVIACSLCHYPNGKGRPENAGVSGLPYDYFVQTMLDFKNDKRKSSDARKANTNRMIAFAKAMSDDEIKAAATYFAAIKWTPWIRVVETDTVPKTRIAGGMFLALEGADAGKEPIGQRIIEAPEKTEETELLRNPRSGFVAYVPTGAVKKGEALARTGQCALCHGANLEGRGPVPGIAGRSPSYTARQLYDMQSGARKGVWTDLMTPVVEKLTAEDIINLTAYTASRGQAGQRSEQ